MLLEIDYTKLSNEDKLHLDMKLYGANCHDKQGNWIDIRTIRVGLDGLIYKSESWKETKNIELIEATINKYGKE